MKTSLNRLLGFVLLLLCSNLSGVSQNLEIVKNQWRFGLADKGGEIIVPYKWEKISPIPGTAYYVVFLGGKYGLINSEGEMVVPAKYSYIIPRIFGDKILVNLGATIVNTGVEDVEIVNSYLLKHKTKNETTFKIDYYYPAEKNEWMPRLDYYVAGGKWGIFNLREFIPSISPSYDILQLLDDDDRYIGLGYTYSNEPNYNIYDFKTDTFVFEFETKNKKIISSMTLLSGGWAVTNESLIKINEGDDGEKEIETIASKVEGVIDLSPDYLLAVIRRKGGIVYNKKTGDSDIDDIVEYDISDGSKKLSYVKDDDGRYFIFNASDIIKIDFKGENLSLMGNFILSSRVSVPSVKVWDYNGSLKSTTLINKFVNINDGKTLFFLDSDGALQQYDSESGNLTQLCTGCIDFDLYPSVPRYVKVAQESGWDNLWGIFDLQSGEMVVPCIHKDITILYKDLYATKEGSVSTIHSISKPYYALDFYAMYFDEELQDNMCWLLMKQGNVHAAMYSLDSLKFITGEIYTPMVFVDNPNFPIMLNKDFFAVSDGNKMGMIDKKGKMVIDNKYDKIYPFYSSEGFFIVSSSDGKFGYVNPYTGVELPCVFDDVSVFSNGVCPVMKNGKWGLADKDGNVLLSPKYATMGDFYGDIFWLKKDNFPFQITFAVRADESYDWVDNRGKVLSSTKSFFPSIKEIIPNGLWDY